MKATVWFVLGAALLGSGCFSCVSSSTSVTTTTCGFGMIGPLESPPILRAGVSQTVTIGVPQGCQTRSAASAFAEVLDPFNVPVTASVTLKSTVPNNAADVVFTPMIPGSYHVTVWFEPSVGIVQRDFTVVADHTLQAPVRLDVVDSLSCFDFFTTPKGGLVCLDGNSARLMRLNRPTQQRTGRRTAGNADGVWVEEPAGKLARYVDDGNGWVQSPNVTLDIAPLGQTGAWLPGLAESVWVTESKIVRFKVEGESLTKSEQAFSATWLSRVIAGTVLPDGDLLFGLSGSGDTPNLCRVAKNWADPGAVRCARVEGAWVGATAMGMWYFNGSEKGLRHASLEATGTAARVLSTQVDVATPTASGPNAAILSGPLVLLGNQYLLPNVSMGRVTFDDFGLSSEPTGHKLWVHEKEMILLPAQNRMQAEIYSR